MSVADFGSYLPERTLEADFFEGPPETRHPLADVPLFRLPQRRHHVAPGERAAEMIEKAARPMFDRLGVDPAGAVDLLITNVLLPDTPFTGCGAEAAYRLGCVPRSIIDLHNGGCASFMYMLKLARAMIDSGDVRTVLLANVQNTAGQVFAQSEVRKLPHAAVPGDGCGVAYLTVGEESPVLDVETRNLPECAADLDVYSPDGRRYWQPGSGQIDVRFDQTRTAQILDRGNRLIPELVTRLCARIGVGTGDIDKLVTNQPNRIFLQNWRTALGLEPKQHPDTFDMFGNLYGAAVPITLDHLVRSGGLDDGDLVVLAGFAHAGDFAAAAALRWHGGVR
jgi:3-oxoacyl-[acyl-carrier-protein] synthase-3